MKFGIIDPQAKTFDVIDAANIMEAYARVRLDPMKTDHGTVFLMNNDHRACCIVYEFGFFIPAREQHYFAIGQRLIAGRALIYEADRHGYTVGLSDEAVALIREGLVWFTSADEVELAIAAGAVPRPELAVNGEVLWAWPDPAPPEFAERMER